MKIAMLSSASAGGAGIAAFRIFETLSDAPGVDIDFIDISLLGQVSVEISPTGSGTNKKISNTHFTIDYASEKRDWVVSLLSEYDVINIHWASYLISLSEIHALAQKGKKILFTLHDFQYITGGCHYPAGCLGYLNKCIGCPQVNTARCSQLTVIATHKLKRAIFSHPNVHLAAPSKFIVDAAVRARIVPKERSHVLRNAYKSEQDHTSKPVEGNYSILLIADSFNEQRKGLALAVEAIKLTAEGLSGDGGVIKLHLVGGLDTEVIGRLDSTNVEVTSHGHIKEHHKLIDVYKQCQFVLSCSYEDNWPNILVEAGCYGCLPIVGRHHGCHEFAFSYKSGFVARFYTPQSFAEVLFQALNSHPKEISIKQNEFATMVRTEHSPTHVRKKYIQALECTATGEQFKKVSIENDGNCQTISSNYLLISLGQFRRVKSPCQRHVIVRSKPSPFGLQEKKLNFELTSCDNVCLADLRKILSYGLGYGLEQYTLELREKCD